MPSIKMHTKIDAKCEIFTFPTDADRHVFIADILRLDAQIPYATNIDPDQSEPERYLVAIPRSFYDWATS